MADQSERVKGKRRFDAEEVFADLQVGRGPSETMDVVRLLEVAGFDCVGEEWPFRFYRHTGSGATVFLQIDRPLTPVVGMKIADTIGLHWSPEE